MKYCVTLQETTAISRVIDADSEEQASDLFQDMVCNGEVDFNGVEILDSDVYVSKVGD